MEGFENWDEPKPLTWHQDDCGLRKVVGQLDGWNWGWIIVRDDGEVLAGRSGSDLDPDLARIAVNAVAMLFHQ